MNVVRTLKAWPGWADRLAVGVVAAGLTAGVLMLAGCSDFFPPLKNPGGGGGGGGTGTDFVYTLNATAQTVSGFSVGTGTLTFLTNKGFPFALGYTPQAAAVQIGNAHLYVASANQLSIFSYILGGDGSLGGATQQAAFNEISLDVSPDGKWLIGLNGTSGVSELDVFSIDNNTGNLTFHNSFPYSVKDRTVIPKMVKISPDGKFIYAALGTNGNAVFSFDTNGGTATPIQQLGFTNNTTADNAVAVDSAVKYAYFARTGFGTGIVSYPIASDGTLTAASALTVAAGSQPLSVVLDTTGKFAYVANGIGATISGFSLANGRPTPLNPATYASGTTTSSVALDQSGKYLLATAFGGPPDLYLYGLDATTGKPGTPVTASAGTPPTGASSVGALLVIAEH